MLYKHPKAGAESFEYLQDVFRQACISKEDFYIVGDFNDDLLLNNSKLNGIEKKKKQTCTAN